MALVNPHLINRKREPTPTLRHSRSHRVSNPRHTTTIPELDAATTSGICTTRENKHGAKLLHKHARTAQCTPSAPKQKDESTPQRHWSLHSIKPSDLGGPAKSTHPGILGPNGAALPLPRPPSTAATPGQQNKHNSKPSIRNWHKPFCSGD